MLKTQGGRLSGLGLYMLNSKPVFVYNLPDIERLRVEGKKPLKPGKHIVTRDFKYDGDGIGKGGVAMLTINGNTVASENFFAPSAAVCHSMKR